MIFFLYSRDLDVELRGEAFEEKVDAIPFWGQRIKSKSETKEILVICQDHVFFYRSVSSFKLSASILNVTLKRVHMTKTWGLNCCALSLFSQETLHWRNIWENSHFLFWFVFLHIFVIAKPRSSKKVIIFFYNYWEEKKNRFGDFLSVFLVMNFIIVINVFFEEAVTCFLIQCCKKAKFTFEWCLRELPWWWNRFSGGAPPALKWISGEVQKDMHVKSKFNVNFSHFFILKAHILYSKIKILKYIIFRNIVKLSI